MLPAGEIEVDNYTVYLGEEIGRGGFGSVYKGKNREGLIVAAKKINLINARHPDAHIKEAISFHRKPPKHKNIIELFNIDYLQNDFWMFMEYAGHGDLNDYYQKHFGLIKNTRQRILLMKQIACGIAYLHCCDIIHRDIKPGNILALGGLIPEETVLKITDFGLAKYLDQDADTSAMSTNVGTAYFKAPEFWIHNPDGSIHYHRNVDTFSAGLTFQAMLQATEGARLAPFLENTLDPIMEGRLPIGQVMVMRHNAKQTSVNPIADRDDDSSLKRGVKQVIRKMVHMIPEHRMQMQDVYRILSSEETLIREVISCKIPIHIQGTSMAATDAWAAEVARATVAATASE